MTHPGELALRRMLAGEQVPSELEDHAEGCPQCRGALSALQAERARFEADLPFERFAAGVERAARSPAAPPSRPWSAVLGMAAGVLLAVLVGPLTRRPQTRVKGGADIVVRVAGPHGGPQRFAAAGAPEALSPGERVRIGYRAGRYRFVAALSLDERGNVFPLYPQAGPSLPTSESDGPAYLPDSLEFTGRGLETVVVVLSDAPLEMDALNRAAREAYAASGGNLGRLPALRVSGEQFQRVFLKP